jgi:hypothetical protein
MEKDASRIASKTDQEIEQLANDLATDDNHLQNLQKTLTNSATPSEAIPTIAASIAEVTVRRVKNAKRLETLRFESLNINAENLYDAQSLLQLRAETSPADRPALNRRIRARIATLVTEIWVLIQPIKRSCRIIHVQIFLRSQTKPRYLQIEPKRATTVPAWDLADVDLRTWHKCNIADMPTFAKVKN